VFGKLMHDPGPEEHEDLPPAARSLETEVAKAAQIGLPDADFPRSGFSVPSS